MTGEEYIAIFQENGLIRSELVCYIEQQIRAYEFKLKQARKKDAYRKCDWGAMAEELKWVAITLAEEEKENQCFFFHPGELGVLITQ